MTLAGFLLDQHEVTSAEYDACVAAGGCSKPEQTSHWKGISADVQRRWSHHCTGGRADRKEHPINCVSWEQATAYCRWAKGRLPTEAEWEFAARGSAGRRYPWGAERAEGRVCTGGTCPVGRFPTGRGPSGALDLAGKVSEWTASVYCGDYDQTFDGTSKRVARGSSWRDEEDQAHRVTRRSGFGEESRFVTVGFRCARDL